MRVASCMIALALLCATSTGCSLFKKNTNGSTGPVNGNGPPPAKFPGVQDPLFPAPAPNFPNSPGAGPTNPQPPVTGVSANSGGSILAGTVMDAYHRPVGNAYIRWVNLDDKDTGAPIDVAADAGGHFIIQGVKPGASYKLIARTKAGEKMFAGTVLTSAPNVRVVIPIRESIAGPDTPPLPGVPGTGNPNPKSETNAAGTNWNPGQATNPNRDPFRGFGAKPGGDPNLPATMTVPAAPANPTFPPGFADNQKEKDRLPILKIPNKQPGIVPNDIPPPPVFGPSPPPLPKKSTGALDTGPTRVPSCALVGNRLENLALRDTKGQVWEYRKQGQGKLVLIDFWATSCIHCPAVMPALNRLQTQYGSRGLEVIGIALEPGNDERKNADQVNKLCNSMQITYRQLLGHVGSFDAGQHFNVKGLPTLILMSESGDIIYNHMGRPDAALMSALERIIQNQLTNRPF